MKRFIAKIFDHIFFARPLLLIPIWVPAFLGFYRFEAGLGFIGEAKLFLLTTFMGIGIYGLNQIFDAEADAANAKNLPLSLNLVSKTFAQVITFCAYGAALSVALTMGLPTVILCALGLLLGIFYSAPRFAWKDKPFAALAANAFGHGFLIYMLGYIYAFSNTKPQQPFAWIILARALAVALAYGGVYLFTTVPDISGDAQFGKRTFAVVFGARKTFTYGLLAVFAAGAVGLAAGENALFLTALLTLPFYFYAVSQSEISKTKIVFANKLAVLLMALFTCFFVPMFFPILIFVVAMAAIYYRFRLNENYP